MNRRIVIDRLELDLRGVDSATAEAAVHLLGPALQAQFARAGGPSRSARHIDAGRVAAPGPARDAQALAQGLALRIAQGTRET